MKIRRSVAVVIALSLLLPLGLAVSFAYAVPPDATWIAGIYDGGDHDDAIGLVSETAATTSMPAAGFQPILPRVSLGVLLVESATRDGLSSSRQPRAPPTS